MTQEVKNIKDNILSAIESGKVSMKPRWHFVAKGVLLVVGTLFAFLSLVYLISFIFFILKQTGLWFVPGFGFGIMREILFDFPWLLVTLAILLILLLQFLIKKYSFSYGRPLIYSVVAVVCLVVLAGFAVSATPIHKNFFMQAQNNNFPVGGKIYKQYGFMPGSNNLITGEIIEDLGDGYNIHTPQDEMLLILVTPETKLPYGKDFQKGDKLVVVGKRKGFIVTARGIREVENDVLFVPPMRKGMPMNKNGMEFMK